MTKVILWFIGIAIALEALAWAFDGFVSHDWMLWAAGLVALRLAYLAGKSDRGPK